MQRRRLLFLAPLVPLGLFVSRHLEALRSKPQQPIDYREQAVKLNQLAAGIHTVADARMFVDFVADIFSEQLPPALASSSTRAKVAEAEFAAVTDPHKLITEQRVAEVWNTYARTIEAPRKCQVSVAEVHNLRDAFFTTANLSWTWGMRTIWIVPAIYATRDDGVLAGGCRAIEAARIFWDLATMPGNLESARVRVSQGQLASDLFRQAQEHPPATTHRSYISEGPARRNPIEDAEREYVTRNGIRAFGRAVTTMLDQALA